MEVRNKIVLANNPYPSRLNHKFHPPNVRTDYRLFVNPVVRLQNSYNKNFNGIDIEGLNVKQFKKKIKEYLNPTNQ